MYTPARIDARARDDALKVFDESTRRAKRQLEFGVLQKPVIEETRSGTATAVTHTAPLF